jgi:hypothetical protein
MSYAMMPLLNFTAPAYLAHTTHHARAALHRHTRYGKQRLVSHKHRRLASPLNASLYRLIYAQALILARSIMIELY